MRAFIHFDWINGRMEGERYYNNIYYIFKLYIAITRKREREIKQDADITYSTARSTFYMGARRERETHAGKEKGA